MKPHKAKSTSVGVCRRYGRKKLHIETGVSWAKTSVFQRKSRQSGHIKLFKDEKGTEKSRFLKQIFKRAAFSDFSLKIVFFALSALQKHFLYQSGLL